MITHLAIDGRTRLVVATARRQLIAVEKWLNKCMRNVHVDNDERKPLWISIIKVLYALKKHNVIMFGNFVVQRCELCLLENVSVSNKSLDYNVVISHMLILFSYFTCNKMWQPQPFQHLICSCVCLSAGFLGTTHSYLAIILFFIIGPEWLTVWITSSSTSLIAGINN